MKLAEVNPGDSHDHFVDPQIRPRERDNISGAVLVKCLG